MPTKIEWTDETWNPIRGTVGKWHCTKVSEGCKYCYAERLNRRFGGPAYVVGADTLRLDKKVLEKPLHWKKPRRVFVCSMTDLFHEDLTDEQIRRVFDVMFKAKHHTFQVLTKRPRRMKEIVRVYGGYDPDGRPSLSTEYLDFAENIWLGVSVEDQATADERIPELLKTPAAVRFLSCEPLLGPLDLRLRDSNRRGPPFNDITWDPAHPRSDGEWMAAIEHVGVIGKARNNQFWVIVGGESGPHGRPMHPEWARSIRDQCQAAGVAFFMKQMAKKAPIPEDLLVREYPHACQIS